MDAGARSSDASTAGVREHPLQPGDQIQPGPSGQPGSIPSGHGNSDYEVNPASLNIRHWESNFAGRLYAFVATPRAAKRFTNIYRLLKAGIDSGELEQFEGTAHSPGDFRAVMVLLAILTGFPALARTLFDLLVDLWAAETPAAVFGTLRERMEGLPVDDHEVGRLAVGLAPMLGDLPDSMEPFKTWTPRVARFSFETARGVTADPQVRATS